MSVHPLPHVLSFFPLLITTTSSTGGLHRALIKANYCFRQKAECCKRVTDPLQSGTILFPRFVTLLFNVLLYRKFCDITNGLHIVPSCPKRFVPFALQIRVSVINHPCALPFRYPIKFDMLNFGGIETLKCT